MSHHDIVLQSCSQDQFQDRDRDHQKTVEKTRTRTELKTIAPQNLSFQALLIVINTTAEVEINM